MLETIREYALERLDASPDAEAVRSRHALRFLALAEEAVPHLLRVERRAWLTRLEREHDNLRAAFDFCAGSGRILEALRLAAALWRFWQFRGHLREGVQQVRRVLDDPASHAHPAAREAALETAGGLAYWLADMTATTAAYDGVAGARARERRPSPHLQRALQPLLPRGLGRRRRRAVAERAQDRRHRARRGAGPGPAGRRSGRHRPLPVGDGEHPGLPAQGLRGGARAAGRGDPDLPRGRRPLRPRLGPARRGDCPPADRRSCRPHAPPSTSRSRCSATRAIPAAWRSRSPTRPSSPSPRGTACGRPASRARARRSATSPAPSWCRRSTRSRGG